MTMASKLHCKGSKRAGKHATSLYKSMHQASFAMSTVQVPKYNIVFSRADRSVVGRLFLNSSIRDWTPTNDILAKPDTALYILASTVLGQT